MTDAELRDAVDSYFANHLDAAYWSSLTASQKSGAVAMGKGDVFALLPASKTLDGVTDATDPIVCGIAEQAVYLVRNYEEIASGKVVTSEAVSGLSQGYTLINAGSYGMSARAMAFVEQARKSIGGTVPLLRG